MNENKDKLFNKTSINWYPGHMAKTKRELKEKMPLVDCVYELIDARMPYSSKIKDIEEIFNKTPRILVMTKKDLCDISVTNKWVEFYKNKGYEVILLDLTNNNDYKRLIELTKKITKPLQEKRTSKGLKKKEIKVCVVGIPNVGKSTLINKLAGRKIATVANKPGVTKNISWLKTNNGILLMDTPGILWPKIDDVDISLNLAATATIKAEILNMTDIGGFIISFLKNYYPEKLIEKYKIDISPDIYEIFMAIAKKIGAYYNGEVDYEKVSQKVYNDIVSGAIKGVTFDQWKTTY